MAHARPTKTQISFGTSCCPEYKSCDHVYGIWKYTLLGSKQSSILEADSKQNQTTVYPKKYAHGCCFAGLCCGYTLTDFPLFTRLTSLALWQSNDCPSASKATLMNMDKYFMWIHYKRLHNHNKAKHNKTVCIFLGIYCNLPIDLSHRIYQNKN